MRIVLAVHGYPDELAGGTERSARELARGLAAAGHRVTVVAGTLESAPGEGAASVSSRSSIDRDPRSGCELEVVRLARSDLYFDHWHKSLCPPVSEAFGQLLVERGAELVHVHHWIRLSRDLVAQAARAGVPAVATLHDLWTTCPIAFRVRGDTRETCEAPVGPEPCLACAGALPPHTPWVARGVAERALAERQEDLARELSLARALIVPGRSHGEHLEALLGPGERAPLEVVPPPAPGLARRLGTPRDPARSGRLVLATWGHLQRHKGLEVLIDSLAGEELAGRVELHVAGAAGDALYERELHARASGSPVHFHGPYEPEGLPGHAVAGAHVLVVGARAHESHGLVLDEALQLGLPVVLPDLPVFRERAGDAGWALHYAAGDARALARVLAELLERPGAWSRLVERLPAEREAGSSRIRFVERHEEIYRAAVGRGAPVPPGTPDAERGRRARAWLAEWDRALSRSSAEELGLPPAEGGGVR